MTASEKLKELAQLFEREGIEDAAREAALLIAEILRISKTRLHSNPPDISASMLEQIDSSAARRIKGEPMQYLIGHVDFWGLKIHVGEGVLIPRPETELLVEEAIRIIKNVLRVRQPFPAMGTDTGHGYRLNILDLCTGSGCIALALAKSFPHAVVCGIDKSAVALSYAKKNAGFNRIRNASFVEGDLFSPINIDARFGCIVSNPPYIRRDDIPGLQREIAYEPLDALDGGEDGLDFYRRILREAPNFLKKEGLVILEIGFDQAGEIRSLATGLGFQDIRFVRDYSGIDRIFIGRY